MRHRYILVSGIRVCVARPAGIRADQWPSALRHCCRKMGDKILAPFQYSGTMDSSLFEVWFSNQLLPALDKGTVIVMDNASFHSKRRLFAAAQNTGCKLLFLPPYSPELNPIEKFWAWLKRFLRKILPLALSFDEPSLPLFNCGDYSRPARVYQDWRIKI